jgi:hypothetical protein
MIFLCNLLDEISISKYDKVLSENQPWHLPKFGGIQCLFLGEQPFDFYGGEGWKSWSEANFFNVLQQKHTFFANHIATVCFFNSWHRRGKNGTGEAGVVPLIGLTPSKNQI